MKFKHIKSKYKLPKLFRVDENNTRKYYDEEGNEYNSTTKVVGYKDRKGIEIWRARVGESVADYISERAMTNGTKMHEMVELYLYNKPHEEESLLPKAHFENIKPLLNNINNISGLEIKLCSKQLGLAGTADCIGEYNGVQSIIDFKTSTKKKRKSWIKKYFMQTTAYSLMWEELTNQSINQIVILISGEDGSREEFIMDRDDYVEDLYNTINMYNHELQSV